MVAEAGGGDLIDGDAGADVGAVGLAGLGAGEEGGHGAGVVATTVTVRAGLVGGEAGENSDLLADGLERFEDGGELEVRAFGGGGPVLHVLAVGDVDEGHAIGGGLGDRRGSAAGPVDHRAHRFEPGDCDGATQWVRRETEFFFGIIMIYSAPCLFAGGRDRS